MSISTGRQEGDKKTGRPLIETLMAYQDPLPGKRKPPKPYMPGLPKKKAPVFVPRKDFVAAPTAEELRLANSRKKRTEMDDETPEEETRPKGNGHLIIKSLGMISEKVTREGLSKEEQTRKARAKREEVEQQRRAQADLGDDYVIDHLTGQPKKKPPATTGTSIQERKKELAKQQRDQQGDEPVDIFGRPLPKRPPPKPESPSINMEASGVTSGIIEHYDKLLAAQGRTSSGVYKDPMVGAAPGIASGQPKRPPPQKLPEVDILGAPLKPGHDRKPDPNRKKMFPTDSEPVSVFGDGPTRRPAPGTRGEMPDYICNPPPPMSTSRPPVQIDDDEVDGDENRPAGAPVKRPPPVNSEEEFKKQYERFYMSSTYSTILTACNGWGIRRLRFLVNNADTDNDGMVSRTELRNAMMKFGAPLEENELVKLIDLAPGPVKTSGGMQLCLIPTLMNILRRGGSVKRKQLINAAYKRALELTQKNDGHMTLDDLESIMDFSQHVTFKAHVRGSMREVIQSFTATWGQQIQRTTVIQSDMFMAFFEDMGVSCTKDSDFSKMMIGMFHMKAPQRR